MANRSKYSYHMVINSELPFLIGVQFFFVMMSFIFYFMQLEQFLFKNDPESIIPFPALDDKNLINCVKLLGFQVQHIIALIDTMAL